MANGSAWFVIGWIALHLMALAWACGTRVAAGSCVEGLAHFGFYVALAIIGAAMLVGRQADIGWIWSAMTFMAMVITAVIDFRHVHHEPARVAAHR
jgi:hypothetical protein